MEDIGEVWRSLHGLSISNPLKTYPNTPNVFSNVNLMLNTR